MSVAAVAQDFSGASFCILQIQLDGMIAGYATFWTWPGLNIAKFLMAMVTVVFEGTILFQICYYGSKAKQDNVNVKAVNGQQIDLSQDEETINSAKTVQEAPRYNELIFTRFYQCTPLTERTCASAIDSSVRDDDSFLN